MNLFEIRDLVSSFTANVNKFWDDLTAARLNGLYEAQVVSIALSEKQCVSIVLNTKEGMIKGTVLLNQGNKVFKGEVVDMTEKANLKMGHLCSLYGIDWNEKKPYDGIKVLRSVIDDRKIWVKVRVSKNSNLHNIVAFYAVKAEKSNGKNVEIVEED